MIGESIKKLRKIKDYSQEELSEILGVTQKAVSLYESGKRIPPPGMLQKLADEFDVTVDYLMGRNADVHGVLVPVLGEIRAGIPMFAQENILDYEEISPDLKGDFFALRVKGNSMAPRILEDDVVIVRRESYFKDGDICVVMVNGENATLKKVEKRSSGVMLIPLNSTYTPSFYTKEEVDTLPVQIIGTVVELRGKF